MAHEFRWLIEGRVIYTRTVGEVTPEELSVIDQALIKHLSSGFEGHLVHVVVDMRELTQFPRNLQQIKQRLTHLNHPALGWTIMVGAGTMITFVANVVTQIARARFRAFSSMAEGLDFLAQADASLSQEALNQVR